MILHQTNCRSYRMLEGFFHSHLHPKTSCSSPSVSPGPGSAGGGPHSPSSECSPAQSPCWPAPPAPPPAASPASGGQSSPSLPASAPPPSLSSASPSPPAGLQWRNEGRLGRDAHQLKAVDFSWLVLLVWLWQWKEGEIKSLKSESLGTEFKAACIFPKNDLIIMNLYTVITCTNELMANIRLFQYLNPVPDMSTNMIPHFCPSAATSEQPTPVHPGPKPTGLMQR